MLGEICVMGNRLKELRERKGISQQLCADEVGISVRTLQRYEHGKPGCIEYLIKLAKYYSVSLDYLEGETDEEKEK